MFLGIIITAYAIPWLILTLFLWRLLPPENFRSGILALEALLMTFGAFALHCLIKKRRAVQGQDVLSLAVPLDDPIVLPHSAPADPLEKNDDESAALQASVHELRDEAARLGKALEEKGRELVNVDSKLKEWMLKCQQVEDDRNHVKKSFEEQLAQKESLILQYQETIASQHRVISKYIPEGVEGNVADKDVRADAAMPSAAADGSLDGLKGVEKQADKVSSIITASKNLEEEKKKAILSHFPLELFSEEDLQGKLKKCIEGAVKLGAPGGLGGRASKLSDFAFDGFAIDLRRLFEHFRWEKAVIFIYSPQQDRLLFVNEEIKDLLGWSPDKVLLNFPTILVQGINYWRKLASSLGHNEIRQLEILLKTREGKTLRAITVLGVIPSGTFQHLLIGIFASPSSTHLMFQN